MADEVNAIMSPFGDTAIVLPVITSLMRVLGGRSRLARITGASARSDDRSQPQAAAILASNARARAAIVKVRIRGDTVGRPGTAAVAVSAARSVANALANSAADAKRSAGSLASAVSTACSTPGGIV